MYQTILVPTDGSDHAVRAAEHAKAIARRTDGTVRVLGVVDARTDAGPFSAGGITDEEAARLKDENRDRIEAVEEAIGTSDRVRTEMVLGQTGETILEYAEEHDADMLAMGTHGRTGVSRFLLGSVTERVVRRAPFPVLTARATERAVPTDGYEDVLVPTDGSDAATEAVPHGVELARSGDGTVHGLNVVDPDEVGANPGDEPSDDGIDAHRSAGDSATETVAAAARDAGLDAVTAVQEGHPAERILEYVDVNDVDLVAMGTQGRTGSSRFLLGSTTERVIRHSPVPVLAVNARDDVER